MYWRSHVLEVGFGIRVFPFKKTFGLRCSILVFRVLRPLLQALTTEASNLDPWKKTRGYIFGESNPSISFSPTTLTLTRALPRTHFDKVFFE